MTSPKNAAQASVSVSDESAPLNLHHLYQQQAACGYTRDLVLRAHQVQDLVSRLRGINAITAVLIAGDDTEQLHLGDWLRAGLTEAVGALAWDMTEHLERINERACKQEGAA